MRLTLVPGRPAAEAEIEAVLEVLRGGWLTMGPQVQALEAELCARAGAAHAVAVASEAAALHLALIGAGAGPGDEVVVPAVGGGPAAAAARRLGAEAVPADVAGPQRPHLDVAGAEARLTERTRAVVLVHPADARPLRALCERRGLRLVEHGLNGPAGDLAAVSLAAEVGTGGAVLVRDAAVAERLRRLRSHGLTSGTWDRHRGHAAGYDVVEIGLNARLDEARAALARMRLDRLGHGAGELIFVDDPDAAAAALAQHGIETRRVEALAPLPNAAQVARHGLEVPAGGEAATRLRAGAGR